MLHEKSPSRAVSRGLLTAAVAAGLLSTLTVAAEARRRPATEQTPAIVSAIQTLFQGDTRPDRHRQRQPRAGAPAAAPVDIARPVADRPVAPVAAGNSASTGIASYYGREEHGGPTASGERFNMYAMTAAHRTAPIGSRLRVTNLNNGKSVVVRINDRGPFIRGRIIDVSRGAADALGFTSAGLTKVRVEPAG